MMTDQFYFFWGGPFSQWAKTPFTIDGIRYNCAEQYMMAQKAKYFGDQEAYDRIMAISDPREQKAIGRSVQNFDADKWSAVAMSFVYTGNWAKFTQNPTQMQELLSTGTREIVEASPYDTVWGIGMGEDDPDITDKTKWRGTNWLGEVLMAVRRDLFIQTKFPPNGRIIEHVTSV